ncbi:hypothetical protein V4890_08215 [Ralstonia solanacearum species complex bacterium KE056]|uniref:SAM-dependent methyltransferase n=1 Tax=Ralstonia solanacearum species complex bacterium KE056 TaxID=3119585 RepID=UPI002FC342A2
MTTSVEENVSPISQWYDMMTRMFPDERLTFLNYGYLEEGGNFDWIDTEDLEQKCSTNLIRTLLGDADLRGKKVLEIGSGRGGNCSYLARYAGAASVTGLDSARRISSSAIECIASTGFPSSAGMRWTCPSPMKRSTRLSISNRPTATPTSTGLASRCGGC